MMNRRCWSVALLVLGVGLAGPALGTALGQVREANVVREGAGAARAAYDALELKPFPSDAWGKLADWQGGAAPAAADLAGKPVLIACFASWHAPSQRAWRQAVRLAEQHAKDGLVVIGAHHPEGWAEAEKTAGPGVLMAHDAQGEFRKALRSSSEPSFFVIDRAGQLRFAGVATSGIAEAVRVVTAETADAASTLEARLKADAQAAQREKLRSTAIRGDLDLAGLPELPYTEPPRDAFEKARWPRFPRGQNQQEQNQQDLSRPAGLPEQGWFPKRPSTKGRAVVLYFWSQHYPETYERVMQRMDVLSRELGRDAVVAGVMTSFRGQNEENSGGEQQARDPQEAARRFERMQQTLKLDHSQIPDLDNALLRAMPSTSQNSYPMPYAAVVSSDGVVRWAGALDHPGFRGAVDTVLREDPGIRARRAAEEAFIREQQKK